jgi:hypothetical protein
MAEQPRRGGREPVEGKPWSITSVRALLGKPRLVGDLTYKSDVVGRGRWEPILDRETFANLQTALTSRARGNRAASNSRRYLLSGIATCGGCGAGLQTGVQNAGNAYRRYRCPNPARGAGGGVRHGGRNMAALDEYVVSCLFDLLEVLRDVDLAPGEVDPTPEIERLRDRLNEAADQYADDLITAEQADPHEQPEAGAGVAGLAQFDRDQPGEWHPAGRGQVEVSRHRPIKPPTERDAQQPASRQWPAAPVDSRSRWCDA